jgi:hypothetical protein
VGKLCRGIVVSFDVVCENKKCFYAATRVAATTMSVIAMTATVFACESAKASAI